MTTALPAADIAIKIKSILPDAIREVKDDALLVDPSALPEMLRFLKNTPGLEFNYLTAVTATDYWDYFEIVYILTSLNRNHSITIKTRVAGRDNPAVPSITPIFQAADYQEREIAELLGIRFAGHPDPKPLFLWEGFQGYPLRKDYL